MQVTLNWNPVANALFYNVYRATQSGGPYLLAGQSNPSPGQTPNSSQIVTTFQDGPGNLTNGQDYYYVVTAVVADGETSYSAEFHAAWPGVPTAVTNLTAVIV